MQQILEGPSTSGFYLSRYDKYALFPLPTLTCSFLHRMRTRSPSHLCCNWPPSMCAKDGWSGARISVQFNFRFRPLFTIRLYSNSGACYRMYRKISFQRSFSSKFLQVIQCTQELEARAKCDNSLELYNLYCETPPADQVADLLEKLGEANAQIDLSPYSPACIASVLKKYLRELPDPVLPVCTYDHLLEASSKLCRKARFEITIVLLSQRSKRTRTVRPRWWLLCKGFP